MGIIYLEEVGQKGYFIVVNLCCKWYKRIFTPYNEDRTRYTF